MLTNAAQNDLGLNKKETDHVKYLFHFTKTNQGIADINNNNNYLFYIAPQQQLYELLALYRSTNVTEHTSICYLN